MTTKNDQPSDPWTLDECVHWITRGDPTPQVDWLSSHEERHAEARLYRALRGGVLSAFGKISPRSQPRCSGSDFHRIPPEAWTPNDMHFWSNELEKPELVYTHIVISKRQLLKKVDHLEEQWPNTEGPNISTARAGRKVEYDREGFWRLAFWHFITKGGPKNQADFVREMGPVLDLAWEDQEKQPAATWLKDRAREAFDSMRDYEFITKQLEPRD